jgi:hypothetical protein
MLLLRSRLFFARVFVCAHLMELSGGRRKKGLFKAEVVNEDDARVLDLEISYKIRQRFDS